MGFFGFIKKKIVPANYHKENDNQKKNDTVKKTYINLLEKYTSISFAYKSIDIDVRKRHSGTFVNKYDFSMFLVSKGVYAIRFNDDMRPKEFHEIFELLKNDWGLPNSFSEYDGYVWNQEGCIITLGLVSLNHCYEVPMICVRRDLPPFSDIVPFEKYILIADYINKHLIERGINLQENAFYKVNYSKEFGYGNIISLENSMVSIAYKNNVLKLSIIPLRPEGEFKAIEVKQQHRKEILVSNVSTLDKKLDQLLEETREYHGLTKIV